MSRVAAKNSIAVATRFVTESGEGAVVVVDGSISAVILPTAAEDLSVKLDDLGAHQGDTDLGRYCAQLLQRYFMGEKVEFIVPHWLPAEGSFSRRVMEVVARIPYGEVRSYGDIAKQAGSPRAARAVGSVMSRNPIPIIIPCHRVVGSNGELVGFSAPGGTSSKRLLLSMEGVCFNARDLVESMG